MIGDQSGSVLWVCGVYSAVVVVKPKAISMVLNAFEQIIIDGQMG